MKKWKKNPVKNKTIHNNLTRKMNIEIEMAKWIPMEEIVRMLQVGDMIANLKIEDEQRMITLGEIFNAVVAKVTCHILLFIPILSKNMRAKLNQIQERVNFLKAEVGDVPENNLKSMKNLVLLFNTVLTMIKDLVEQLGMSISLLWAILLSGNQSEMIWFTLQRRSLTRSSLSESSRRVLIFLRGKHILRTGFSIVLI